MSAFERLPPQTLKTLAAEAMRSGNWSAAADHWGDLCVAHPDNLGAWAQRISCLSIAGRHDEADRDSEIAMKHHPLSFDVFAAWARVAERRRHWPSALDRWRGVSARFPDRAVAFAASIHALRETKGFEEAEEQLRLKEGMFEGSSEVAIAAALLAASAKEWKIAADRWKAVRNTWPEQQIGYTGGSNALRELRQIVDAENVLNEAIMKFGRLPDLLSSLASLPEFSKDWSSALGRWREVAAVAPDSIAAALGIIRNSMRLGQTELADKLLADVASRHPDSVDVLMLRGIRAQERKDWATALEVWQRLSVLNPERQGHSARAAGALRQLRRFDEAEAALAVVLQANPTNLELLVAFADIPQAQGNWSEAKRRWKLVLDLDPGHKGAIIQSGIVDYQLAGVEADSHQAFQRERIPSKKPETFAGPVLSSRDMFMDLEGLGDNCEFGLVQRRFGAEPVGLFRWTGTSIEMLSKALGNDLEGVGLPEHTRIGLEGEEYYTTDTRYGMRMHTFIHAGQESPELLLARLCQRQQYLKRELLEDLREGNHKLYVYKSTLGYKPDSIERLHRALERFGHNTLLCIKLSDDDHLSETVEVIAPGIIIGYIPYFTPAGGDWSGTAFGPWERVCRKAHFIWRSTLGR